MPNWCNNKMTIKGPHKIIDKIEKIVKDESNDAPGLLNYLHPMPKGLNDTTSPDSSAKNPQPYIDGYTNWYDWCVNNWGTKWELSEYYGHGRTTSKTKDESSISFIFSSAWSPPINALAHFLEQNENCEGTLLYFEGGCDFAGLWDNGNDVCISPSDYKSDDEYWQDGIGKEIDDEFNILESMAEYEADEKEEA